MKVPYGLLIFLQIFTGIVLAPVRAICLGGAWLFCRLHPWDIDHWFLMTLKPYIMEKTPPGHWLRRPYVDIKGRPVLSYEQHGPDDKFFAPEEYIEGMTDEYSDLEESYLKISEHLYTAISNEQTMFERLQDALAALEEMKVELQTLDLMYGPEKSYESMVEEYRKLAQTSELARAGHILVKQMEKDGLPLPWPEES